MKKYVYKVMVLLLLASTTLACAGDTSPTPSPTAIPGITSPVTQQPVAPKITPKQTEKATTGVPYYQGKTIEMIIASGPGGGADTTGRTIASFLPKYIPGNPKMISRNIAGAATIVGNNNFVEKAQPDGLTLITSSFTTQVLTTPEIAKYDMKKYEYLGNLARACTVIMVRKDSLPRLTDPKAKPLYVGSREGTEGWSNILTWGQELLGWNIKWILGYQSTQETDLAVRRGEIDIIGQSVDRSIEALKIDPGMVVLTQEGMYVDGKMVRRPDYPDVPTFEEMLRQNNISSGLPFEAFNTWIATSCVDKYIAAPPNTPSNIMTILVDSFKAMSKDPQFVDTTKKLQSSIYVMNFGQDAANIVKKALTLSPEHIKYGEYLRDKYVSPKQ